MTSPAGPSSSSSPGAFAQYASSSLLGQDMKLPLFTPQMPDIKASYYGRVGYLVTDVTICFGPDTDSPPSSGPDSVTWRRLEKDLYLHSSATNQTAWLYISQAREEDLGLDDLVVTDIQAGGEPPEPRDGLNDDYRSWESRPGGIRLLRSPLRSIGDGDGDVPALHPVADIDVLFGADAVDPRPPWTLMDSSLRLPDAQPEIPVARLTVRRRRGQREVGGRAAINGGGGGGGHTEHYLGPHRAPNPNAETSPAPPPPLRARADGSFKVVQISDTHMIAGGGSCDDALDGDGRPLPELSDGDAHTTAFVAHVLDAERPGLVLFTGDGVHHGALDTQTVLFKVVAPAVERGIPFAVIFGNHDDEGLYALSRAAQMSILQDLPSSLSQPGPEDVDGVGNYYLQIFGHASPEPQTQQQQQQREVPLATLFLLDSHGNLPSSIGKGYAYITPRQIEWFTTTSRALRKARDEDGHSPHSHEQEIIGGGSASATGGGGGREGRPPHLSVAFIHIPVPEYGDAALVIRGGHQGEPVECSRHNSHFYDALAAEGVVALGCGHDHVNDFCGLLPRKGGDDLGTGRDAAKETEAAGAEEGKTNNHNNNNSRLGGPWLCFGGSAGFHAYGSYGGKRYYRRARVWEFDLASGGLRTWKRVEYAEERVHDMVLVRDGEVDADAGCEGTREGGAQKVKRLLSQLPGSGRIAQCQTL